MRLLKGTIIMKYKLIPIFSHGYLKPRWWTWILPASYVVYARIAQWVRKSPTWCRQLLGFLAGFLLFTVPHVFQYYSYEYIADDFLAFALFSVSTLLLSLAAFCLLIRSAKQVS